MTAFKNFRTFDLSVQFYGECKKIQIGHALKDQLQRAASSISLNLAEGSAKPSEKERLRYYSIALGSLREIQAIIKLESLDPLMSMADHLGACLYKLSHPR